EKIQEELGDEEPTDDELKAYFKENYYRAKHILIEKEAPEETEEETAEDTEDTAEDTEAAETAAEPTEEPLYGEESANALLERAQGGENFDEMIAKYSTDPGSESNPDGYVFTEGDMVEPFYEGVKSIEPGEFTVAESDYGYHIIQRLSLSEEDEKFNEWFEDNKDAVEAAYEQKQLEDKLDEYCEQYGITVERDDETIAKLTEDNAVVMPTPIPTSTDNSASY
ncbi:MAG: peptidylprolyl isomerase, partial [Candidatus Ornithomonoglobus sp.]